MLILLHLPVNEQLFRINIIDTITFRRITMSNVKVEKRKQEKYNRKKIEASKKRKNIIAGVAALAVVAAIAVLLGFRIYDDYFKYDATADINPSDVSTAISAVQQAGYEEPEEEDEEADKEADKDSDKDSDKKEDAESDKKDEADKDNSEDKDAESEDKKDDAESTDEDKKDDKKEE